MATTGTLEGTVKRIRTKTEVDKDTGGVEHTTTMTVVIRDLDQETLSALAVGEYTMRTLSFKLV